jgi:hypothetical protein
MLLLGTSLNWWLANETPSGIASERLTILNATATRRGTRGRLIIGDFLQH